MASSHSFAIVGCSHSAGSNPVGTAKNDAKEPIKKVGFLLFHADFALNFAGFFSYAPRVRKTAFSDRTRDLA